MVTVLVDYVPAVDKEDVLILLGQIIVIQQCHTVLDQDVLGLVVQETGHNLHMEVTFKDSHRLCILVTLATVGSIMDILQEHLT